MSRTSTTTQPMHRFGTTFKHPYHLKFLITHIPPKPISFLSGQRSCVAHTSTNRTHNPKRDTKATTFRKTFNFGAFHYFTNISFHTYIQITFVINRVIMVTWLEISQFLFYLAGGNDLNVYSWFSFGFLFRP